MEAEIGKKYKHIPSGLVKTIEKVQPDEVITTDKVHIGKTCFDEFWKSVPNQDDADRVNHPSYYKDPSGVECITVARHRDFNIGNALKYLWRAGLKTEEGITNKEKAIEDLKKAIFYINDEIKLIENDWKS